MKLSPSQQRILECFYKHGNRVYSWQLCQEAFTSDYRRRIHELRKMGYEIQSFSESCNHPYPRVQTRHGYILIPPSQKQAELEI
mgnify:CR=1 FL=1